MWGTLQQSYMDISNLGCILKQHVKSCMHCIQGRWLGGIWGRGSQAYCCNDSICIGLGNKSHNARLPLSESEAHQSNCHVRFHATVQNHMRSHVQPQLSNTTNLACQSILALPLLPCLYCLCPLFLSTSSPSSHCSFHLSTFASVVFQFTHLCWLLPPNACHSQFCSLHQLVVLVHARLRPLLRTRPYRRCSCYPLQDPFACFLYVSPLLFHLRPPTPPFQLFLLYITHQTMNIAALFDFAAAVAPQKHTHSLLSI